MGGPLRRNADEIRDAIDGAGRRSGQRFRGRQGDQAGGVRDRTDAVRDKDDELAASVDRPSGVAAAQAPSPTARVDDAKLDYIFGLVSSGRHNRDRSQGMYAMLWRLGLPDTPASRGLVRDHLLQVALDDASVMRTFTSQYGLMQIRDSLFATPGAFLRFESTWHVMDGGALRFVTVVMLEGA